jgi:L-ascorbate metabolism protein UlaG (beta-lactamase superfamily)
MREPLLRDEEFLRSLEVPIPRYALRISWLGQSGFLLEHNGGRLVVDPYLSDSLTTKYVGTDLPHVRMAGRVVDAAKLTGIEVVTSSHNHTDHLDAETLIPLRESNAGLRMVIPEANRAFVANRLGCAVDWPIGVDDHIPVEVAGWRLTGVAAAHNELDRDERGRCRFLGFIIQRGPWTIYHSGDTLRYKGLIERVEIFAPSVALLPINGNKPERRVAGNMDGREAADVAQAIGAKMVIPHHFDMFEFNTADPNELFVPACEALGQPFRVLRLGEHVVLENP